MSGIRRVSNLGTQGTSSIVDGSIAQSDLNANIPLSGLRNKVINGSFDIWQRGSGPIFGFSNYGYGPDRWRSFSYGGSNNTSISRGTFTLGNQIPGFEPQYFVRIMSMSTATLLSQPIEDVRTCAGQQVTISFWAKTNSVSAQSLIVRLEQYFGTGGSPSSTVQTNLTTVSVTGSWQKFTVTGTVPSISGKTIGSNNDHYLDLIFFSSTTAVVFDFWGIQLEQGSQPTPFEQRPIGIELLLCQRYYEIGRLAAAGYGSVATVDSGAYGNSSFASRKRIAPTITEISKSLAGSPTGYASSTTYINEQGFGYRYYHGGSSGSGNLSFDLTWSASCEL